MIVFREKKFLKKLKKKTKVTPQVADEKQQHQDWQASDPGFVPWGRRLDAKRKEQQSRLGSSRIIKDPESEEAEEGG